MSIIKRLSTTLFSQIDSIVGEIENHDALIKATLTEQRKKIAAAKVQLSRIQSQEKSLQDKLSKLNTDQQLWAQRAVKEAKQNEAQALRCLDRRRHTLAQIQHTEQALTEYHSVIQKMLSDITQCEQELREYSNKHELMKARQTSSSALQATNTFSATGSEQLNDSFQRWEIKLTQGEYDLNSTPESDSLEAHYLDTENQESLRNELQALLEEPLLEKQPLEKQLQETATEKENSNDHK